MPAKTGHQIFNRYKETGHEGLTDRLRRPCRHGNQLPFQVESLIVTIKQDYPGWGAFMHMAIYPGWRRAVERDPICLTQRPLLATAKG